ncbi:D-sedoheptulose-7-phosphate isomerase [Chitinophaga defluvii]|uniref:SIS domain-containing protein n=1 Tax=Chitinophaga defluvii TaxID=3163343 RepID=A0ABV2T1D8_9BACT
MESYVQSYIQQHQKTLETIPADKVAGIIEKFREALKEDRQIFVIGNGGSAANASHFVTDLGKGASDKTYRRFRCLSLNDNVSWITALGNDYSYDDVFAMQLANYGRPGDLLFSMSVSGNSPNLVKAMQMAKKLGMYSISLVGGKVGTLGKESDYPVIIDDLHYGRVEDAHMGICHIICYAFMEDATLQQP